MCRREEHWAGLAGRERGSKTLNPRVTQSDPGHVLGKETHRDS